MIRLQILVEAGWDEADELADLIADILAEEGYGHSSDNDNTPVKSIIAIDDDPVQVNTAQEIEVLFNTLAEQSRSVILPRISAELQLPTLEDYLDLETPSSLPPEE